MKKALSTLAGISLLALAGTAGAQDPTVLSDGQMDGVTAGLVAFAGIEGGANVLPGDILAETGVQFYTYTQSVTTTDSAGVKTYPFAVSFFNGAATGYSVYFKPVASQVTGYGVAQIN